jgi:type VI secretion system protein ImpH
MATTPGPAPDHLNYLRQASARIGGIAPLALLRGAEARARQAPPIGTAKLPTDDVVTLVHCPSLAFPAATLAAITVEGHQAVVEGHWLGLTGAMGPLPLHLTDYAASERQNGGAQPYGRFLDVLAGRMLQLFYRAWASAVPAVSIDRRGEDHFGGKIAALTGAQDGAADHAAFPAESRLHHAGFFASPRSPGGLGDALSAVIRLPVRIVEYVERWRDIDLAERTVLGGGFSRLGQDAVAGCRICTVEEAFKVIVQVSSARDLRDLLPGGARYRILVEAIDSFAPPHLDWEIELATAGEAIRPARLGAATQLGWSSWSAAAPSGSVRSDARLGAHARRLAPPLIQDRDS